MCHTIVEKNTLTATRYFVSMEVSGDPKLAKVNRCVILQKQVSQTTSRQPQRGKDQSSNEKDYGDKQI